jgi:hypothetical protein
MRCAFRKHPSFLQITLHEGNEGFAKIPNLPSLPSPPFRGEGMKEGIGGEKAGTCKVLPERAGHAETG